MKSLVFALATTLCWRDPILAPRRRAFQSLVRTRFTVKSLARLMMPCRLVKKVSSPCFFAASYAASAASFASSAYLSSSFCSRTWRSLSSLLLGGGPELHGQQVRMAQTPRSLFR